MDTMKEVASAVRKYWAPVKTHLKDKTIWVWVTDNGGEFRGNMVDGPGGLVEDLVKEKHFSVPNVKNSNPVPERAWGDIQRAVRACHSHAEAPPCLWVWAVQQSKYVYHHMASTVHSPPRSTYEILHPDLGPVEMGWAHTMFCDVIVTLPERDVYGKTGYRSTLGCHLGYDYRRRGHFVYCPKEQRLGTYKVLKWYEDKFEQCQGISGDTPVEYHTLDDLQFGRETGNLLPKFIRRAPRTEDVRMGLKSVSDMNTLTGMQAYQLAQRDSMEREDTLLWISSSTPAEGAYAVTSSPENNREFPRTIAEAKKSPL